MLITNKKMLIIVTEGPTDEQFYKRVLSQLKIINSLQKFSFDKIKYLCAKGIGNLHNSMLSKFRKNFCQKKEYKDYEKYVCFCYDKDVFKVNKTNPPININRMKKEFMDMGAKYIIEVVADDMIEDFITIDYQGIKNFLNLGRNYKKPSLTGLNLLKRMFLDASKVYVKGDEAKGLIESLDIELILSKICIQMKPLCNLLGCNCNGKRCKRNVRNINDNN